MSDDEQSTPVITPGNTVDDRLALTIVRELLDASPNYRVTSQWDTGGRKFICIEIADEETGFREGAPGAFVSMVAGFGDGGDDE